MGIGRNQYIDLMNQYRAKVMSQIVTLARGFEYAHQCYFLLCYCLGMLFHKLLLLLLLFYRNSFVVVVFVISYPAVLLQ